MTCRNVLQEIAIVEKGTCLLLDLDLPIYFDRDRAIEKLGGFRRCI